MSNTPARQVRLMSLLKTALVLIFFSRGYSASLIPNSDEDQTAALQAHINQAASQNGGTVQLAPGRYRIDGSLTIPTGVTLQGTWTAPHHASMTHGTILCAYGGKGRETGPALLEMQQSSTVRGLTIVYPEQQFEEFIPYPWAIHGQGMHNTIENVTFVNAWQGISIGPESNELHLIRNVFGCVLRRGIRIDGCTDIGRIENVHFNPHYWPRSGLGTVPVDAKPNPDLAVAMKTQEILEAFTFARTDWEYVTNTFTYGARIGYLFTGVTDYESCNGQFSGIGADMARYCVKLERVQPYGILISNGEFVAGSFRANPDFERIGIVTTPAFKGTLQLSNCSFWGFFTHVIELQGDGFVSVNQASILNHSRESPLIDILGGRATIANCMFRTKGQGPHISVSKEARKVFVTSCMAEGDLRIAHETDQNIVVSPAASAD